MPREPASARTWVASSSRARLASPVRVRAPGGEQPQLAGRAEQPQQREQPQQVDPVPGR